MVTLTEQQEVAVGKMVEFASLDERMFLLLGYAGTGKSTCIWSWCEKIRSSKRAFIAFSAPTNKAVNVLKKISPISHSSRIHFSTIHQILGLTSQIDNEGNETFKPQRSYGSTCSFPAYDFIVIDEASMINAEMWKLLQEAMQRYRDVKIIFMGDSAQLPPVNEDVSPVFTEVKNSFCLTQVIRFVAEKPVGTLVNAARSLLVDATNSPPIISAIEAIAVSGCGKEPLSGCVYSLDSEEWLQTAIAYFKTPEASQNPDYIRCIAWTNRAVSYLNSVIRSAVYGEESQQPFLVEERLVASKPVFVDDALAIQTSTELEVVSVRETIYNDYAAYRLRLSDPDSSQSYTVYVIKSEEQEKWQARCELMRRQAASATINRKELWKSYYQHLRLSAPLDYCYAMTAHKSQGSTFENVFISYRDICRNPRLYERYKCLYVAFSRASKSIFLCGCN